MDLNTVRFDRLIELFVPGMDLWPNDTRVIIYVEHEFRLELGALSSICCTHVTSGIFRSSLISYCEVIIPFLSIALLVSVRLWLMKRMNYVYCYIHFCLLLLEPTHLIGRPAYGNTKHRNRVQLSWYHAYGTEFGFNIVLNLNFFLMHSIYFMANCIRETKSAWECKRGLLPFDLFEEISHNELATQLSCLAIQFQTTSFVYTIKYSI
jgi:hypothetical protein